MHKRLSDITGVVLVGGKSRRMGQDKAFLAVEGVPVIERILLALQGCFEHLLLVGDRPERFARYRLQVVPDSYPGSSLGGLYTGLQHAETDLIFVSSCDIPFPDPELIRLICAASASCDAVVPATAGGPEPLFALYRKSCLPLMQAALEAGQYRINAVLGQLNVRTIAPEQLAKLDPGGRALLNINTPQEYAACRLET
ncbi:molybdenum cofactor guanylyltransferase [Trichlorobacter lovleyi]|uniref:Probable molybdenum cofactor guanylyltransferase n=1 Tax=Trichlorobacter lovleyi (strain ATCC BAA-1151 / DSM 17278 / SZ) TaxID=398767 RepID=B3E6Q4_TRIL1|nr:molybdenum cofactor guanylyltransferase [Trichlorobacter lovleyi]ACD94879.1 molybdopterin-guanine dinucleotide biosynthesis protein A-like protein [Trichlorobacter lovleyi SZ]